MRNVIGHITRLCFFFLSLSLGACSSDIPVEVSSTEPDVKDNEVTLALQVCIDNASGSQTTRAVDFEFVGADDVYEMMHTLRVIIVRPDNTVEHNRMVLLKSYNAQGEEVSGTINAVDLKELEFKVSTSQGKPNSTSEYNIEEKRIYLIANEKTITEIPISPNDLQLTADLNAINAFLNVNPGEKIVPDNVSSLLIYNNMWRRPSIDDDYLASPYINNSGSEKKYIPMTESFIINVGAKTSTGETSYTQKVDLFVTRSLVKFQFHANDGEVSFRIKELTFQNLMQKEYLFPFKTEYKPAKNDPISGNENREIVSFQSPAPNAYFINRIGPYNFNLTDIRFGATATQPGAEVEIPESLQNLTSEYLPALYFCETDIDKTDDTGKRIYTLSMKAEVDMGDGTTEEVTFEPKQIKNLPYSLPRNTIVKVYISISNNHELICTATLLPYTGVWLYPDFGL